MAPGILQQSGNNQEIYFCPAEPLFIERSIIRKYKHRTSTARRPGARLLPWYPRSTRWRPFPQASILQCRAAGCGPGGKRFSTGSPRKPTKKAGSGSAHRTRSVCVCSNGAPLNEEGSRTISPLLIVNRLRVCTSKSIPFLSCIIHEADLHFYFPAQLGGLDVCGCELIRAPLPGIPSRNKNCAWRPKRSETPPFLGSPGIGFLAAPCQSGNGVKWCLV